MIEKDKLASSNSSEWEFPLNNETDFHFINKGPSLLLEKIITKEDLKAKSLCQN